MQVCCIVWAFVPARRAHITNNNSVGNINGEVSDWWTHTCVFGVWKPCSLLQAEQLWSCLKIFSEPTLTNVVQQFSRRLNELESWNLSCLPISRIHAKPAHWPVQDEILKPPSLILFWPKGICESSIWDQVMEMNWVLLGLSYTCAFLCELSDHSGVNRNAKKRRVSSGFWNGSKGLLQTDPWLSTTEKRNKVDFAVICPSRRHPPLFKTFKLGVRLYFWSVVLLQLQHTSGTGMGSASTCIIGCCIDTLALYWLHCKGVNPTTVSCPKREGIS